MLQIDFFPETGYNSFILILKGKPMKKLFSLCLAIFLLCGLAACGNPNSQQLNLYQGCGQGIKLIHLNARTEVDRERIASFAQALADCRPLEKSLSLFAYYPDFKLEITGRALVAEGGDSEGDAPGFTVEEQPGATLTAIVDINGDFVDFYFPGPAPAQSDTVYRSSLSAKEFKQLVNYTGKES